MIVLQLLNDFLALCNMFERSDMKVKSIIIIIIYISKYLNFYSAKIKPGRIIKMTTAKGLESYLMFMNWEFVRPNSLSGV